MTLLERVESGTCEERLRRAVAIAVSSLFSTGSIVTIFK